MRKLLIMLSMVCVLGMTTPALIAFAAENDDIKEPSNVTIIVVMPEKTPPVEQTPPTELINVYPSDVTEVHEDGQWQIIKTYELAADENPDDIPQDSFERNNFKFTLTDIIRKETANAETREHSEKVTINTDTKELEKILPLLKPRMEYKDKDGFVGILALDLSSIKVETAGTKTSSYTMSITREYPHLSSNDTSFIPKTVQDKGKTYTLASIDWQAGNTVTIDYETIPEYYTAVATYNATGTSTKVTGYITTAEYTGTLAKLSQGKTVYTAYFLGEEIQTPLEMTTPETTKSPKTMRIHQ